MGVKRRLVGLVMLPILATACQPPAPPAETDTATAAPAMSPVERGQYLVTVGGCNDCHSPKVIKDGVPEPDTSRLLSGHPADVKLGAVPANLIGESWGAVTNGHLTAWVGPWGASFAMNLTPDNDTGLGSWTEEMFLNAIKTGKHQGTGRGILPPMPWAAYRNMTDDDLKAVFAYLQSLPPVKNAIPEPLPPDKIPR